MLVFIVLYINTVYNIYILVLIIDSVIFLVIYSDIVNGF